MALLDSLVNNDLVNKFIKSKTDSIKSLAGGSRSSTDGESSASRDQFEFSKYDVASLTYPDDLLGNGPELASKNYVIFYINVSVDSKVLKEQKAETVSGVKRDLRGALIGQGISAAQAKIGSAAVGALAGSAVGGFIAGVGGIAGGGAAGAIGGAISATILSPSPGDKEPAEEREPAFSRPQKRLKKAIALHMPNNLRTAYNVSWGEQATAAFAAGAAGAEEIGKALANVSGKSPNASNIGGVAGDVLTGVAAAAGPSGLGIGAGLAANPKKEQEFQGVDFRNFTYTYQFAPRDDVEAGNIIDIINTFKFHMHPEFLNSTGFTYVYPSEFDIIFYNGTNENPFVHKHSSCVLTALEVDYAPNGNFVTFANGMPTQINVSLSFRELLSITKETVERGL